MPSDSEPDIIDIAEILKPHRPTAVNYWLALFVGIIPVWSITPLSWAYAAAAITSGTWRTFGWGKSAWLALALAEVAFSLYHAYLVQYISAHPNAHSTERIPQVSAEFLRCMKVGLGLIESGDEPVERPKLLRNDPRAIEFRNALRPWFGHAAWSQIRTRELRHWLHWQLFNAVHPGDESLLTPHHHKALDDAIELLRDFSGCEFEEGSNPEIKPIMLTVDPLTISSRPLAWYALVAGGFHFAKSVLIARYGMQFASYDGLDYAIRIPPKSPNHSEEEHRPILLLHGLGLGLFQYFPLLAHIMELYPHRPVLFPIQPHISQMMFHPRFLTPYSRHDTAARLAALMDELGWGYAIPAPSDDLTETPLPKRPGVTILSHSNGSYVHAWLCKGYPHMIARSCFIDPVSFLSWEGEVCYNFVYRPARTGLELLMRYFVASEMGVANLLQRHFDWTANCLYPDEVPAFTDPSRTTVFIGAKDAIINAQRVYEHLTLHGMTKGLSCDPHGHHGGAIVNGSAECNKILRWLGEEVKL